MSNSLKDDILLYPERILSGWKATALDWSSLGLPISAAVAGAGGGITALKAADQWAAGLAIASAVLSALGVIATGYASRNRDRQIAAAHAVGWLGVQVAERNTDHSDFR